MRNLTLPLTLALLLFIACGTIRTGHSKGETNAQTTDTAAAAGGYDAALADRLGADEYGMKNYVLCFLKPGKQRLMMVSEVEALELRHLEYMQHLVDEGTLVMMGMFPENREFYAQLVLNTDNVSVADSIIRLDPKVKKELVVPEFHPWYGPAALSELKAIHERITRKSHKPVAPSE